MLVMGSPEASKAPYWTSKGVRCPASSSSMSINTCRYAATCSSLVPSGFIGLTRTNGKQLKSCMLNASSNARVIKAPGPQVRFFVSLSVRMTARASETYSFGSNIASKSLFRGPGIGSGRVTAGKGNLGLDFDCAASRVC